MMRRTGGRILVIPSATGSGMKIIGSGDYEKPEIPIILNGKGKLERGLYRDIVQKEYFYLSKSRDKWYIYYSWSKKPILLTLNLGIIYAEKADPAEAIKGLKKEQRFIESKLKEKAGLD